ncbi:AzlC family ABC transporter permease [Corynebacterium sp.]|uniref:AzlC family ABC transporter permease n=1 Tax=Corynebacterium sp. TaxID=1720 RepID=UPI0026DFF57B|nr:AzlC family ABC transporter permease [Corynebacterium sp.]MDO5511521.1 AzlC family ABC transporter permease [Corynebacterium sp.]
MEEVRAGVRDSWAVALGLIPLGLAFGLLMSQGGFSWWWTPIFSIAIYAGSMEFLAMNLVITGVGPVSAAITALMVNFRHVFYGLTFPRDLVRSGVGRAYSTYALTDESYAIAAARPPSSGTRALTIQAFCQLMWVLPGIVGAVVGEVIPSDIQGMEFALVALFVVLAWETFRNNRDLSLLLLAGGLALLVGLVAPGQLLLIALSAYFLLLLARHLFPTFDRFLEWRV